MCDQWVILTGEYPPQPGGVSDYTRQVARGLAAAGKKVHVWAPTVDGPAPDDPGIKFHRLCGGFRPSILATLDAELDRLPRPLRLLLQYVPDAFGYKAMNLPFCLWLSRRGRRDQLWTMFHEVAHPILRSQSALHNFQGAVNFLMASLVARASTRIFLSIPGWRDWLRPIVPAPVSRRMEWLPVPSNVPTHADAGEVAAVRTRLGLSAGDQLVGHFGTFGSHVRPLLDAVVPGLLSERSGERRFGLLIGRAADAYRDRLIQAHPPLAGRLHAAANLSAESVAAHVAACDLLVQPYHDGVSGRRTTVMAALALGVPVVTTGGLLTEPLWPASRAVALSPAADIVSMVGMAEHLLGDEPARSELVRLGRALYAQQFSLDRLVDRLLSDRED